MEISAENRVWIKKNGKPFLGSGRIGLLEGIDKYGSISKAAHEIKMSYKKAWELVESMNSVAEAPLVIKETGGKNGGGSIITDKGKLIIDEFRKLEEKSRIYLEEEIKKCCIK
jgi:molybdate transport system regulatory protein